jgi:hypothetical protein
MVRRAYFDKENPGRRFETSTGASKPKKQQGEYPRRIDLNALLAPAKRPLLLITNADEPTVLPRAVRAVRKSESVRGKTHSHREGDTHNSCPYFQNLIRDAPSKAISKKSRGGDRRPSCSARMRREELQNCGQYRKAASPSIKRSNFHFGIEPVCPAYIFAIQVSSVTVITKNANAIPMFLCVC